MPRTQTNMMHNHRTMPYPPFSEVPSSRSYQSDYTPTGHERPSAAWTTEDDTQLMQLRTQGMNWGPISTNFPGKTSNACRKRHERLMEKKNAESWDDSTRIEHLSRAYLQVREQMWKILAETLGEKWQTVETKVGNHLHYQTEDWRFIVYGKGSENTDYRWKSSSSSWSCKRKHSAHLRARLQWVCLVSLYGPFPYTIQQCCRCNDFWSASFSLPLSQHISTSTPGLYLF